MVFKKAKLIIVISAQVDFTPRWNYQGRRGTFNNDKRISSPRWNNTINTPNQSTRSFEVKTDGPAKKNKQIYYSSFRHQHLSSNKEWINWAGNQKHTVEPDSAINELGLIRSCRARRSGPAEPTFLKLRRNISQERTNWIIRCPLSNLKDWYHMNIYTDDNELKIEDRKAFGKLPNMWMLNGTHASKKGSEKSEDPLKHFNKIKF